MFINVGKHVMTKRESPFISSSPAGERFALALPQRIPEGIKTAKKQVFLVVEMRVERRATYISAIDDVLHRKPFETLLLDEREKSRAKKFLSSPHAPVFILGHQTSSALEQIYPV